MGRQAGHHTVREFYLRRFGDPRNAEDARIVALEKESGRRLPAQSARNLAKIRDFYTIAGDDADDGQELERLIAGYEAIWADALRTLDRGLPLDSETRFFVSQFVAFQLVRTTRTRGLTSNMMVDLTKWLGSMTIAAQRNQLGEEGLRNWVRQFVGETGRDDESIDELIAILDDQKYEERGFTIVPGTGEHLKQVVRALDEDSEFIAYVFQRRWQLLRAPKREFFVTSDHPVTLVAHPSLGYAGLRTAQAIGLPIAPDRYLVMGAVRSLQTAETTVTRDELLRWNLRTIASADRWIYLHPSTPDSSVIPSSPSKGAVQHKSRSTRRRRLLR